MIDPPQQPQSPRPEPPHPGPPAGPLPPVETSVRCLACGQNLTGSTIGGNCPECGTPITRSMQAAPPVSAMAVASMVLGIMSLVSNFGACVCLGFTGVISVPLGIGAIVLSRLGARDIAAGKVGGGSVGMNITGLICGIAGAAIGVLGLVFIGWIFVMGAMGP
jgi:hypothetical protein